MYRSRTCNASGEKACLYIHQNANNDYHWMFGLQMIFLNTYSAISKFSTQWLLFSLFLPSNTVHVIKAVKVLNMGAAQPFIDDLLF